MKTISAVAAILLPASSLAGQTVSCDFNAYRPVAGLDARHSPGGVELNWDGTNDMPVRMRLIVRNGVPTIDDLALNVNGNWRSIGQGIEPEFRVTTGLRRISNQQLVPMRALGMTIDSAAIDAKKWDVFWDAPLYVDQGVESMFRRNPPPPEGIAHQPGLPRNPAEIQRANGSYHASSCTVATNGARLEVAFPGMTLGVFTGTLQFTVYRGTNLIRMESIAHTNEPSVAYKYAAGLRGLGVDDAARVAWRDLAGQWQGFTPGRHANDGPAAVTMSNRIVVAEHGMGSIAAFPPPHSFFWAREVETVLPYGWYRTDGDGSFGFGVRQGDGEVEPRYYENFSLYSAPPGTEQRMAVFFYVSPDSAEGAFGSALGFTHGDVYKRLPGYRVMANHFHTDMGQRWRAAESVDFRLPDFDALRAAGVDIVGPTDRPTSDDRLEVMATAFEGARRHSDQDFLVMPNEEVYQHLGGHWDLLFPKPVYWTRDRAPGQPFVEEHAEYGRVYHVGSPDDAMEMISRENGLVYMPHPRTKGSTGYPDAVNDTDHFRHERYRGVGWRWGMGLDLSDKRLSGFRVLPLLDEMNNWMADVDTPPKYLMAITETYRKQPGDDVYANNPVNYLRIDDVPSPDDMSSVIDAMRMGDYFVTTGEVLIPEFEVVGSGTRRTVVAEVEWTFPLEFVEVVWGDGETIERQIVSATEFGPFGHHRFEIPVDVSGVKWLRFAVWDSAGNGALVQPVKLLEVFEN